MVLFVKKNVHKGYRKIFKDIEIQKREIFTLSLITFAVTCLAGVNIYFSGTLIKVGEFLGGINIAAGVVLGIVFGGFYVDRVERRYPILIALFGLSPVFSLWGMISRTNTDPLFPHIILTVNIAISIIIVLFLTSMYIQYTTMLERGRVIAFIMSTNAICTILLVIAILNGYFVIIPAIFPVLAAYYLYKHRHEEKGLSHFTILEKQHQKNKNEQENINDKKPLEKVVEGKSLEEKRKTEGIPLNLNEIFQNFREFVKNKKGSSKFLHFLKNNSLLVKYLIIIFIYGLIIGLLLPLDTALEFINFEDRDNFYVTLMIIVLSVISIAIGAFLIGLVFDIYGRKLTLSFIVLILGTVNFINAFVNLLNLTQGDATLFQQNLPIMIGATFCLFISIPLLNGDISRPEFYGRTSALWLISAVSGLLIGISYRNNIVSSVLTQLLGEFIIEKNVVNIILYNYSVSNLVFIACIIILFILANIRSDLSTDEQNWPDFLIHMYIIHNSGLLLYEHTFREEKDLATADLISGGIIGLTTMLKEITKGNQNLRIIDHGDKKLLFQWDSKNEVIFVMVIEQELVIIRHKLTQFIEEFEKRYAKNLARFAGVQESVWESVKDLIDTFFTRKYLHL